MPHGTCGADALPISIRRALKLKDGDKVAFVEIDGQYVLATPPGWRSRWDAFSGFAEANGLETEEDIVAMIRNTMLKDKKAWMPPTQHPVSVVALRAVSWRGCWIGSTRDHTDPEHLCPGEVPRRYPANAALMPGAGSFP